MMGIIACLLLLTTMSSSYGYAAITTSSPLLVGKTLRSPDGTYELGFFSPNSSGNQYVGIWFQKVTPRVIVWVANRENPVSSPMANLKISSNGSLILLDGKQDPVWSSGGDTISNKCHAELLDTGNLVVVDNVTGKHLWQSFEHLGDTMIPLTSLMYDTPNNKKRVLTSWKSETDPSLGEFVAEITPQVPSQGVIWKGSSPYWRSGPWAGTRFTGIPEMDESYINPLGMVQDLVNGTGVFAFCVLRNFNLSYIKLTPEGSLRIQRNNGTNWIKHFEGPVSSCDLYGKCGPFGMCVRSDAPVCQCLRGFEPKSHEEWRSGNWSRGCVRRTELFCQESSSVETQSKHRDTFYHVSNIKPPDSYELASFSDEKQCHQGCLRNCSCTAFSYVNGIGCLVWNRELLDTVKFTDGGETLSIRLARSELNGSKRIKIIITVITLSLSIFLILVLAAYGCWRYRVKQTDSSLVTKENLEGSWRSDLQSQDVSGVNFFDIHTLQTATNDFDMLNKLGQGGFGTVYKGKLHDGKEIAVKRLSNSSVQGAKEFMNEIKLISKLQHRNLVRLLGCCVDGEEKLLVYEYMANKSLDIFLFDLKKKLEIDWPKRFNIIQEIARGLLYLHRDSFLRVVHRDLKVSNILLDEKMSPKISDFGLARMFQGNQYQDDTGSLVGTLGYMSPEYAWTGKFSEKSDIYSFGVLMLEIITGKEISSFSYGKDSKNLLSYAWESWSETGGVNLLDEDLADSDSVNSVEAGRCVQIGLLCVQHQAIDRPNIKQVVSMLTSTTDLPKPTQPMFMLDTSDEDSSLSQRSNDLFSVDENKSSREELNASS